MLGRLLYALISPDLLSAQKWCCQKEITGEFSGAKAGRKCSDETLESSIIIFQTGFHFVPLQPVTHHGPTQNLKQGHSKPLFQWEDGKYNGGKEILLQASLAGKGERAGQGKGEGGEKGKERNQWLLTLPTKALCDGHICCWNAVVSDSLHQSWLFTWIMIFVTWGPPLTFVMGKHSSNDVAMGAERWVHQCEFKLLCL